MVLWFDEYCECFCCNSEELALALVCLCCDEGETNCWEEGLYFLPLTISSGNGELVAHSALPFDHVYAWCGVHSAFDVGLESGKTHGKSAFSNIASTMSFVMRPGQPETPMIVVEFEEILTILVNDVLCIEHVDVLV